LSRKIIEAAMNVTNMTTLLVTRGGEPILGEPDALKGACPVRKGGWRNTVRLCALLLPYMGCEMVYPRIVSTDADDSRLLAICGDVERTGTSTRNMERLPLTNSAVCLTLSWTGTRWKTSKPPRVTT
jgi:hypothetical protein